MVYAYKPQKKSGIEPLFFCIAHSGSFYVASTAPPPARYRFAAPPIAPGARLGGYRRPRAQRAAFLALAGRPGRPALDDIRHEYRRRYEYSRRNKYSRRHM